MARIQTYQNDLSIDGSEKLIGTNNVSSSTTNFVINDIADWMNSHSVIGIAGQTVYKFQSSVGDGRDRGSISFEGYGGQGTLFSDITTMRISKYNLRNVDITAYLNWSVGKDINFFDVNNVSSFGIYAVESLTPVGGTDFFDIVLRHDSSNGSLQEGSYYGISVKSTAEYTVPSLDVVTTQGNTTANSIEVGSVTANGNFLITGTDSTVELRGTSVDFNIQTATSDNIARIATTTGGTARLQMYNWTEGYGGAEEFKATTWEDDALVVSGGIPTTTKFLVSRNPNETTLQVTGDASVSGLTTTSGITSNGLAKIVEDTLPNIQLYANSETNPASNEQMGSLTFSRLFDNPNLQTLATALYNPFVTRVEADGGTVVGTDVELRNDLDTLLAGKVSTDTAKMYVEYSDTTGNMSSDFVFYNSEAGILSEKFRVTAEGNVEVKESLAGVVIRSRNDTPYRILVDNDGRLEATALDAAAPVINGVPTISGIVAITETITATKASVTSSPALTTTYQWQVSDNGTTGWSNISGATSSTYLIPLEYANKFLRVQQIETNILGQTSAFSASTTAVIPSLLVSAMIQRLGNFENETYVYDSLVDFDAIELS